MVKTGWSWIPRQSRSPGPWWPLMDDRTLAIRLGEAGSLQAARMTWADAVKRLIL